MSTLSFVALSMQTTHLDPATVSKASYLKLVDGNITRVDAIPIIPPATPSETGSNNPEKAVAWPEALGQLSMVFGKLPIVSYYRDADKEIFQAASRRSDITPPTFHWLDCRALARQALPELADHQPSTVLKALDLFEDYGDGDTVEQTVRIVLRLAELQGATTVRELWGDLYHQPDDLLDLESTLQELSTAEAETHDEPAVKNQDDSEAEAVTPPLTTAAMAAGAASASSEATPQSLDDRPETELPEAHGADLLDHENGAGNQGADSDTVIEPEADGTPRSATDQEVKESGAESAVESEELPVQSSEHDDEVTAQALLDIEHLEEPEFLKIRDDEVHPEATTEEPPHGLDTQNVDTETQPLQHAADATPKPDEDAHDDIESSSAEEAASPPTEPLPAEEPNRDFEETTPVTQIGDKPATEQDTELTTEPPQESVIPAAQPADSPTQPSPAKKLAEPLTPLASREEGSTALTAGAQLSDDPAQTAEHHEPRPVDQDPKPASRTGRIWGVVGMIVFGLLTVLGLGLTVMAIQLFFTPNDLLLETKIAGVILTGAITLLSLLMTALSYRTYRKND